MITLKQLLDKRSLDSELAIHAVQEWLQQKRPTLRPCSTDYKYGYDKAIRELLEELK